MTAGLKPYPAYKDSGVEWLGQVPEHWEVRRGKTLFCCIDVRSQTGQEELLTVSSERGVVPRRSANVTMFKAESYVGYKLCWPDDLVINSLWAWARGLGVSPYHGIVSSAYGVYRLRNRQQDNPRFIHQLVRSTPFQWELLVRSKGIWVSRLQLTDDAFLGASFPMPPSNEQNAIVRFLNWAEQRIRRVIRARQRRIKLLEEYKQALIHRAVTGQIDVRTGQPYPSYKPSGVEWLGNVPAHWEVQKLKRLGEVKIGLTYAPSDVTGDDGTLVLRASNIRDGAIVSADDVFVSKEVPQSLRVAEGDILVCVRSGSRSLVGKVAIIPSSFSGVTFGAFMSLLRSSLNPFIYWVFNSNMLTSVMAQFQTSTINQLTQNDLRNFDIPLPPLPEQNAIVEYLDTQTAKIDTAIATARREIELLREYRTRLIADVVTGKVDVREVAAQLPEELSEEEAESMDADEIAEDEATDDDATSEPLSEEDAEP